MSADIVVIIIFSAMGLAAHASRNHPWIEWVLRTIYGFAFVAELYTAVFGYAQHPDTLTPWSTAITAVMAAFTGLMLFRPFRRLLSAILTAFNQLINGAVLVQFINSKRRPAPVLGPVPAAQTALPPSPVTTPSLTAMAQAGNSENAVAENKTADESSAVESIEKPTGSADGATPVTSTGPAPVLKPALAGAGGGLAGALFADRVFVPDSIPHLNGLWIYVTVLGSLLASVNLENFKLPSIPLPFPVPMDSLFSYNFLGLVILAACGCGIFVARKPGETLRRLGIVKPEGWHVGIALLCVPLTFLYDYLWSVYTGSPSVGVGGKLATYNAGTFTAGGGAAGPSLFLALATGICAGVGEETLIRGALQPVFGIFPAGFLHGALHGQFQHAPILILQVAGWSTLMGIVRKYTNTTTTIITHATFNFLTTFLFAFNP